MRLFIFFLTINMFMCYTISTKCLTKISKDSTTSIMVIKSTKNSKDKSVSHFCHKINVSIGICQLLSSNVD